MRRGGSKSFMESRDINKIGGEAHRSGNGKELCLRRGEGLIL